MNDLIAAIEHQESLADASGELAEAREDALNHYLGKPYGNEVDGRSSVVMRDVADTIEWIKPSLMKVFASGDEVCRFEPFGPEDVEQAEQETEYCNWVLNQKNNGFLILHDWFHDALLQRTGYVLVQHETEQFPSRETYKALSDDEFALLMQSDPEVLEHSAYMSEFGPAHDIVIRKVEERGFTRLRNIAPERVKVSADWEGVDLQGCPFVEVISYPTISDLRQMGYEVDDNISDTGGGDDDDFRRNLDDDYTDPEDQQADPSTRRVRTRHVWIQFDKDGDGIAELRRVVVVGTTILEDEETDQTPVCAITPMRMPHEHIGQSIDDIVADLQAIRTTLTRGFLDSMYLANNGRYAIDANVVNLDDMLVSRPGGVVRTNGPVNGAIMPLTHPQEGGAILQAIEYVDTVRENRTGVTKYNQGLDSQSLNKTARGLNQIMSASQQRIELIARMFAETGVKNLFLLIHAVSIANGRKPEMIRLRDEWIAVDPREWKTRKDVSVSVGLGTGNKDQMLQHLQMILLAQKESLPLGLATPENIYNALAKMTQNAGFKRPEEFWTDPSKQPPKPPQPNPEVVKAQMEQQGQVQKFQAQAQLDQQKLQAEQQQFAMQTQLDAQKAQADIEQKERDRQVQLAIAQLQEQTKLQIARMKEESSIAQQVVGNGQDSETEVEDEGPSQVEQQFSMIMQAVQELAAMINAPKEIIRDQSGRAVGVSVGGNVREIARGPDGRIAGLQ
jgi:hypothetical protein